MRIVKSQIKQKSKGKVFVGLSGGVDSSVSAALLQKQNYDVTGVFIKVWTPPFLECTWKEDRLDAMRVCAKLGIPFITLDLEKEYKKEVVDYMISEYKKGRTPNPDVMCNQHVKFGAFFNWARKNGADFIATGHYARIAQSAIREFSISNLEFPKSKNLNIKNSLKIENYKLKIAKDLNKDQTYFLWNIKKEQLPHILFPVGHLKKPKVRKLAEKFGLITADKKDSQGLCFLGKIDLKDFLGHFIEEKKGNVLDTEGEVIGTHQGAHFLTFGQRHGFIITKKTPDDSRYYIVGKDIKKNTITVSTKEMREKEYSEISRVRLSHLNWISDVPQKGQKLQCRYRYRQELIPCTIESLIKTSATVVFEKSEQHVSPGQSLVIYGQEECIGGGVIEESHTD